MHFRLLLGLRRFLALSTMATMLRPPRRMYFFYTRFSDFDRGKIDGQVVRVLKCCDKLFSHLHGKVLIGDESVRRMFCFMIHGDILFVDIMCVEWLK